MTGCLHIAYMFTYLHVTYVYIYKHNILSIHITKQWTQANNVGFTKSRGLSSTESILLFISYHF